MAEGDAGSVEIEAGGLRAEIAAKGAELVRLRDEAGRDLLWGGDPAFWTGRSPILFPVVGRLKGDRVLVDGAPYPMRQHGFARTATFALAERDGASCRLSLAADEATRRAFPFDFALDLDYRVAGAALSVVGTVRNAGAVDMPASFGFHPAFRRPLPYGAPAADHGVAFEADEPDPLPVLDGGLLSDRLKPSPVSARGLALTPHLFDDDALVFLAPRSRSLRYGPPGGRGLRIDFPDMPQLGIWSKPGAPFVCLEPWFGHASPAKFDGELRNKPGVAIVPPGGSHSFAMTITLEAP